MNGDSSLKGTEKMNKDGLAFVKGHMGGNEIILLQGAQVPQGKEIDWALAMLDPPHIRATRPACSMKARNPTRSKLR